MEEITRDTFDVIHSYFFLGKRRERDLEDCSIKYMNHPDYRLRKNSKNSVYHYNICLPILHKSISLLIYHGYKDFDPKCVVFEFHRRNYLSFGDKRTPHEDFLWHIDDMSVTPFKVYSIIFYLRKDSTIKGGNLLYKLDGKEKKIDISGGDCVVFPGNIYHCPQLSYGFGCRDSIVVFIRRK
tara:strand:- start:23 stop:568 length:546 start_codon:yes stop_codon:yes gene_type:complete